MGTEAQFGDDAEVAVARAPQGQKRSLFRSASAVSRLPSAVMIVAEVRLSQVRPYARETTP